MSAKQPNRKPAGKRKESDASAQEGRERKRAAKRKGLKAGSRQQVEQAGKKSGTKQAKDPRIGSRKPVALIVEEKSSKPVAPKQIKEKKLVMTPEQELASIENDDRLNDLLDRLDAGETLEATEQAWVDQRVDRYQELMDELGTDPHLERWHTGRSPGTPARPPECRGGRSRAVLRARHTG